MDWHDSDSLRGAARAALQLALALTRAAADVDARKRVRSSTDELENARKREHLMIAPDEVASGAEVAHAAGDRATGTRVHRGQQPSSTDTLRLDSYSSAEDMNTDSQAGDGETDEAVDAGFERGPGPAPAGASGRSADGWQALPADVFALVPPQARAALREHQRTGVQFLWDRVVREGQGAALADTMGLGKTLTVVATLAACLAARPRTRVLLLVPASLVAVWLRELGPQWGAHVPCSALAAMGLDDEPEAADRRAAAVERWWRRGGVLLSSYELHRALCTGGAPPPQQQQLLEPDVVVLDEGHRLRSLDTATTRSLQGVRTRRRLVLTGYPVQNNLDEYWCMLAFAVPGLLPDRALFRVLYALPIERALLASAPDEAVGRARRRTWRLQTVLQPAVLRRGAALLMQLLPPRAEYAVSLYVAPAHRELYRALVAGTGWARDVFSAFNVLSLAAVHPTLLHAYVHTAGAAAETVRAQLDSAVAAATAAAAGAASAAAGAATADEADALRAAPSSKLAVMAALVCAAADRDECTVVFARSLLTLDAAECALRRARTSDGRALRVLRMDGLTPAAERARLVDTFNEGVADVICISTRAGGEGISLTRASRVVQLDVCWNPSHDIEAACRVYRLGQTRPVAVYRLLVAGSAEAVVFNRQLSKRELARHVVDRLAPLRLVGRHEVAGLLSVVPSAPPVRAPTDPVPEPVRSAAESGDAVLAAAAARPACAQWLQRVWAVHRTLVDDEGDSGPGRVVLGPGEAELAALEYETELRAVAPALAPSLARDAPVDLRELYSST